MLFIWDNLSFLLISILCKFKPLLLTYRLTVFQVLLSSDKSFTFRFWKYSFSVVAWRENSVVCYNLPNLHLFLLQMCFNFDLCIIAFYKALYMKILLLNLMIFFLMGACLCRTVVKVFWKSKKIIALFLWGFLFKSSLTLSWRRPLS